MDGPRGSYFTSPWLTAETLYDLGYGDALEAGVISVAEDGSVVIGADSGSPDLVPGIANIRQLNQALKRIDAYLPEHLRTSRIADRRDVFEANIAARFENRVIGGWSPVTEIRPEFRGGNAYVLPLEEVPGGNVKILETKLSSSALKGFRKRVVKDDGTVLFPVHPQELEVRKGAASTHHVVRNASSERTVHTVLGDGLGEVLVKLDVSSLEHCGVPRPVSPKDAETSVTMTSFLKDWCDGHSYLGDPFCFLPEPMALVDESGQRAAIVRVPEAYPPLGGGRKTRLIPFLSLARVDQDDFASEPQPFITRVIENRPDTTVDPVDWAMESIFRPLIESTLRVLIDMGSACEPTDQNTFLEVDLYGQPTGRVAHSDLEGFEQKTAGADGVWCFLSYLWGQNLIPLAVALAKSHGREVSEIRDRVRSLIWECIGTRLERVRSEESLKGFLALWDEKNPTLYNSEELSTLRSSGR